MTLPALEQAQAYATEMETHRQAIRDLAQLRHQALHEARRQGLSAIIADQLGISRQQIHRLLKAGS